MKKVGLRELKNRLSRYVRRARAGERILVTDRGQVVAELLRPALPTRAWIDSPASRSLRGAGQRPSGRRMLLTSIQQCRPFCLRARPSACSTRNGGRVRLYAEPSAVLAWLFGEAAGEQVRHALAGAEVIITSDLTLIECDRVLIRAQVLNGIPEALAADLRTRLNRAAAHWDRFRVDREVVDRARRPFPGEPIRTLDAVHLASALVARAALEGLVLLNLDRRVRAAGRQLGLDLLPA